MTIILPLFQRLFERLDILLSFNMLSMYHICKFHLMRTTKRDVSFLTSDINASHLNRVTLEHIVKHSPMKTEGGRATVEVLHAESSFSVIGIIRSMCSFGTYIRLIREALIVKNSPVCGWADAQPWAPKLSSVLVRTF